MVDIHVLNNTKADVNDANVSDWCVKTTFSSTYINIFNLF